VRALIRDLAGQDTVLQLRERLVAAMVTGFVRIGGRRFGLIANNPAELGGAINADAADKAARFMQLCGPNGLPMVSLCDPPGLMVGREAENQAPVRHISCLFATAASLPVPIYTVVVRKGHGLGAHAMADGNLHAPVFTVSWPTGEFGAMGLEGAVRLGYAEEGAAVEDPQERQALFDRVVARAYQEGNAEHRLLSEDRRRHRPGGYPSLDPTGTKQRRERLAQTAETTVHRYLVIPARITMDTLAPVLFMSTLAAAAIPVGGLFGCLQPLFRRWLDTEFRHTVIAFGGGALLAAVSLVLVPKGMDSLSGPLVALAMMGGGIVFGLSDAALSRARGSASQLLAMLADFIPEVMALGALFAAGGRGAYVLALLIALQNLPEGFNALRELSAHRDPPRKHRGRTGQAIAPWRVLVMFALLVPLGPLGGLVGHVWLADQQAVLGFIMLFASGGILYLVFQDIAPQAQLERHWAPSLGAVAGFLLGVMGHLAVTG